MYPTAGAIFYSKPGFYTDICHVDRYLTEKELSDKEWPSLAKLNFVAGDKNTLTMWYEVPQEKRKASIKKITSTAQQYLMYSLKDCITIKTCSPSGWAIFDAGVPHTVSNPTDNPKWTISFIIRDLITGDWLTYDDCKERLLSALNKEPL